MRLAPFSLVLALIPAAAGGCVTADIDPEGSQAAEVAEVGITPNVSAFVLSVGTDDGIVTVTGGGTTNTCGSLQCNFAYLAGTSLSLSARGVPADCEKFSSWSGACSGQGNPCSLVINSNLSTTAQDSFIPGCKPQ